MKFKFGLLFFKITADYIKYRDVVRVVATLFGFISFSFVLNNRDSSNFSEAVFNLKGKSFFNILSEYISETDKLRVKFIFFYSITISFVLDSSKEIYLNKNNDYFDYLKDMNFNKSKYYKDYCEYNIKPKDIKLIAYYLTQFHPIPENDLWWGKGFTEWTNVSKSIPQFKGHYQPRLPGDLGFYDLRLKDVHKEQIRIAKNYGIYGFCYYFYWFNGRRLLEKPLDIVINNPDLDFPFCLFWANESWCRRWDGAENEIIIEQTYSKEDDLNLIKFLLPIFKDRRYIKVNGKPLINIYRPTLMPNIKNTISMWRKYCIENGIGDIYVTVSNVHSVEDPNNYGADASIESAVFGGLNYDLDHLELFNKDYEAGAWIIDYKQLIKSSFNKNKPKYKEFRSLCPDWDNEARRFGGKGGTLVNSTPDLYKLWLDYLIEDTMKGSINNSDENLIFINAWNEWAEAAYLEPDLRMGYAYLDATSHSLIDNKTVASFNNKDYSCSYKSNIIAYNRIVKDSPLLEYKELLYIVSSMSKEAFIIFAHNRGGGSSIYVENLINRKLEENNVVFLIYFYDGIYFIEITYKSLTYSLYFNEYDELNFIYDIFNIKEIFVSDLIFIKDIKKVMNYILTVCLKYNLKLTYPIHDYFCICPRIFLVNNHNVFCNIPNDENICKRCLKKNDGNKRLINVDIREHRKLWQNFFDHVTSIITFSHSSIEFLNRVFKIEKDRIKYMPHTVDWICREAKLSTRKKDRINVGILGLLSKHKGSLIVRDMVCKSNMKLLNINFYLYGKIYDIGSKNLNNFFDRGVYTHDDILEKIEDDDIDIFVMPSICPETFSYTTEEVIKMNKPLICFNLGAQAERVSKYDKGHLVEEMSGEAIVNKIISLKDNLL